MCPKHLILPVSRGSLGDKISGIRLKSENYYVGYVSLKYCRVTQGSRRTRGQSTVYFDLRP